MLKRLMVLLFLALFLLAACNGVEQAPVSEAPEPEAQTQPVEANPTATESARPEPTEAVASEPGGGVVPTGLQMECSLVSDQPDAPAEFVAIFGVTEDDWVKGPETAAVTIVEYSDFQ